MSNKKNMLSLSVSDTENASQDSEELDYKNKDQVETPKRVYNKKPVFTEEEMEQLNFLSKLDKFEEDINTQMEVVKRLKLFAKEIKQTYQQDIIKVRKMKRHKENSSNTGFNKKFVLPDKFCNLIEVEKGTTMSTPEFTKQIYFQLKKRGLVYKGDKRIYRVDKEFMEVFGIKESVNKSTKYPDDNGLNIGTMQIYINDALRKSEQSKEVFMKDNTDTKIKVSKKISKS